VKHTASPRFWKAYEALPANVRRLADANFKLLTSDPTHPSLRFNEGECSSLVSSSFHLPSAEAQVP